jgi:hypothetical protein
MSRRGAEDLPKGVVALATKEKTLVVVVVVLLVVLSSSHRSFFVCFLEEVVCILDVGSVCLQLWWVWLLWWGLDLA